MGRACLRLLSAANLQPARHSCRMQVEGAVQRGSVGFVQPRQRKRGISCNSLVNQEYAPWGR